MIVAVVEVEVSLENNSYKQVSIEFILSLQFFRGLWRRCIFLGAGKQHDQLNEYEDVFHVLCLAT
jgi:hypothetical protein